MYSPSMDSTLDLEIQKSRNRDDQLGLARAYASVITMLAIGILILLLIMAVNPATGDQRPWEYDCQLGHPMDTTNTCGV